MMANGCFVFEDDHLWASTAAKLNALRKSGQFCDVRLQVCGHEIYAHRAVLACSSPYLFEAFNSEVLDNTGCSMIRFEDLNPEAMEILLNYAYTARLEASIDLVKDVYSAAKKLKMDRVRQVCGDYLLSCVDGTNCISYRNFAGHMDDSRLLAQVDAFIQSHLVEISEGEEFLKLPRLQVEVVLEENVWLPSNGKLCTKVIDWVQRCIWEKGERLEDLLQKVQKLYFSAEHKLLERSHPESPQDSSSEGEDAANNTKKNLHRDGKRKKIGVATTNGTTHLNTGDMKSPCKSLTTAARNLLQQQQQQQSQNGGGCSNGGSGSNNIFSKHEWKIIASEKSSDMQYLSLAVLSGTLCAISLHGRASSPRVSPATTPVLSKSSSLEAGLDLEEPDAALLSGMHYERCGLGAASLNGSLIAAGGYNREECLRTVERYDASTDSWSFIAPMNTPRARFQMATLMGKLFALGGSNGHSDELSSGEVYDPDADQWMSIPELRTNRCNAGVAVLKDRLYIVGGSDPYGQKGLRSCDAFDPISKTWITCSPTNTHRHQASVCELDGFLYVVGGSEAWNCLNTVERYDPLADTWSFVAPMNVARRGAGVAAYNGKLFVVGGFNGASSLGAVEAYDPARDEWTVLASLSVVRSNAGVAVAGGRLYAVGGFTGAQFLRSVEVYDAQANLWSPYIAIKREADLLEGEEDEERSE
ncbi:influenza virus NS1A-binding protein [Lethenteron reissneri]|uniref:influenza virus NS1A-binding protein n=1 Tax=Lethenteron reissneri TaxID=7753 RepID=UPI002AB7E3AE|nr:influenza virus NS1A-binding protein [Lethenteron reissneri]